MKYATAAFISLGLIAVITAAPSEDSYENVCITLFTFDKAI